MTKEEVDRCKQMWLETLKFFGQERPILRIEEEMIARAIQKESVEAVLLALFGARYEPRSERFDPASHVDLARVLTPDFSGKPRIQKFVGYGSRARASMDRENQARESREALPQDLTPSEEGIAKVRDILSRVSRPIPKVNE